MKNQKLNLSLVLVITGTAILSVPAMAAINVISDYSSASGVNDNIDIQNFQNPISSSETFYLSGTLTYNKVDSSATTRDYFSLRPTNGNHQYLIGKTNDNFEFRSISPTTIIPLNGLQDRISDDGTVIDFVVKLNNELGAGGFWLNPDRSKTENNQEITTYTSLAFSSSSTSIVDIFFYSGDPNGYTGQVDYTGFKTYTGTDSPFAVPEIETYGLWLGVFSFSFIFLRRRLRS
jgi:hypothetical protein